jgi:hypothetical protein
LRSRQLHALEAYRKHSDLGGELCPRHIEYRTQGIKNKAIILRFLILFVNGKAYVYGYPVGFSPLYV